MDGLSSPEALIRVLKSPGLSTDKIKLASLAWSSDSLFLPAKNAVLVDWLLQDLSENSASQLAELKSRRETFDLRTPVIEWVMYFSQSITGPSFATYYQTKAIKTGVPG
jgi:hypothetical protein